MLIEYSVENFNSFKSDTTLSMVMAKSFKEHLDTNVKKIDEKLSLLKSAILYGNNASGKSNLLKSMRFMKRTILSSFKEALSEETDKKFDISKFELDVDSRSKGSSFECSFILNQKKYRYGFELGEKTILSEWLFSTDKRESSLFIRENQQFSVNKLKFKEAVGREEDVRDNVLLISYLASINKPISTEIVNWFKNFNVINGIHDRGHKDFTITNLKDNKDFIKWAIKFVEFLDISNISTQEEIFEEKNLEDIKKSVNDEDMINVLTGTQKIQSRSPKRDKIVTYHKVYNKKNMLVDTIAFDFDKRESKGTKKLLYLLGPWYDTLVNGKVLAVDEIDSRLHSLLTSKLIEYFHETNTNNAQLICATHDTSLLNRELFRRDQIWFVDKNQFGLSHLISLAEFKSNVVRNKSAFSKNYLSGKYGSIPYFNSKMELPERSLDSHA